MSEDIIKYNIYCIIFYHKYICTCLFVLPILRLILHDTVPYLAPNSSTTQFSVIICSAIYCLGYSKYLLSINKL